MSSAETLLINLAGNMLDFELQEKLKQHTEDHQEGKRGRFFLIGISMMIGLLIGLSGDYVFHQATVENYQAELNQMVVLAAESKNLDSAATLKAVEAEIGKPISEFSEKDALNAFKYLVRNTKPAQ
jgi:hypothetical protein